MVNFINKFSSRTLLLPYREIWYSQERSVWLELIWFLGNTEHHILSVWPGPDKEDPINIQIWGERRDIFHGSGENEIILWIIRDLDAGWAKHYLPFGIQSFLLTETWQ